MTFLAIGPDDVPGTVSLPTWILVAAVVVLFSVREYERSKWFAKVESATAAINGLTKAVEGALALLERKTP